jgi:catechol 2,3-dioxygenase-like lactoylglutathione lyase family enzyme
MALHRLTAITLGVPDVDAARSFYRDFGLDEVAPGRFASVDGGEQLRLVRAPRRGLVELGVGADDADDVARVATALRRLGVEAATVGDGLALTDPGTGVRLVVGVAPRLTQPDDPPPATNRPGRPARTNARAAAVSATQRVRPRKLGHAVLGSTDAETSRRILVDGLGFKVSDELAGGAAAFLRCSTDHHNLLVQAAPVRFLHHTSWQVADVDEIGRAATAMLAERPERHVWGLGRHAIGSNFFWYLRDPAGSFVEYYSDMDVIVDDAQWRSRAWSGLEGLMKWGPPPPPVFFAPDDLSALAG